MPIIAMTREMGSLGRDVAAGVAARARRKVVYHELIEPGANKTRLRKSHVERFLEGKSGIWERLTTERTSQAIYTADETFKLLREESGAVIRGWGAAHLFHSIPHVIRVRICAPLETRIARMMARLSTDNRETVEHEIQLSDQAHTAITRRLFGVNWRDAENYDLVLSTERLSVDECVEEVEGMMRHKRFQETRESLRMVDNLSLGASVRSALRRDARTAAISLTVECEGGVVRLFGTADAASEIAAANEVAAAVEGVKFVDNQLKTAESAASRHRREG